MSREISGLYRVFPSLKGPTIIGAFARLLYNLGDQFLDYIRFQTSFHQILALLFGFCSLNSPMPD